MSEPRLKEITAGKLNLDFFNQIIRRIEATKPLAGTFIKITNESEGMRITIEDCEIKELDVCKDGKPDKLKVFTQK